MTTMNNFLSSKDKHMSVSNVSSDASVIENQYPNLDLNLNRNFKCSVLTPVQTCSKSFNNKNCVRDSATSDSLGLRNSLLLNKSSKVSNFETFYFGSEKGEAKNHRKNESSFLNFTNKSTLSLHIAAHENSIKVTNNSEGSEKMTKFGLIQKWETAKKLFKTSSSIFQNPFEFSRQQESEEIATPEISQFKASQTLLNPNKILETNVPNTSDKKKLIAIADDISLEDLKKRINVKLANEEIWKKFDKIQLEMVVTKHGRTLYPKLEFIVEGLERENRYLFFVSFSLADNLNVKYKYVRGKWISYHSYDDKLEVAELPHTDNPKSPFGFDWMFPTSIVFEKLKITNNAEIANNNPSNYAHLKSFRKYRPSFIIHRYNPTTKKFEKIYEKDFSIAEFIVVTSYHDPRVTHIKVDNNPYAKAFRGENISVAGKIKIQKPPSVRYQRSSSFPSTSNLRHHNNLLSQPFLSYNGYYQQSYHPYFIPPPPPSPSTQAAMLQHPRFWPTSFSQPSTVNPPTTTTTSTAAAAAATAAAPTAAFLYNPYYPLMFGYNTLFGSLSWIPRPPPPPYQSPPHQAQTSFNQFHPSPPPPSPSSTTPTTSNSIVESDRIIDESVKMVVEKLVAYTVVTCVHSLMPKNTLLNRNPDDGNNKRT